MSTSKTKVVTAVTAVTVVTTKPLVYSREYVMEQAKKGIQHDVDANTCKMNCMLMLAGEYGEHAITPYNEGRGGINCNSFKANSSLDTMQAEAGRLDMHLGKAQELASIIADIRALGERKWQEFQRVMFGRTSLILDSVPVTSIAGEALAIALDAKKTTSVVKKIAKAQLDLAKATGKDTVSAQIALDTAIENDLRAKEEAEHARHVAKLEVDKKNVTKAIDKLEDAIQIAIEVATKLGRDAIADKLTKILALV
jgi:hypothetical protein